MNTYTTDLQMFPAAAMDASGDFIVTWASAGQEGAGRWRHTSRSLWTALRERWQPLGPEFRVNTYTTSNQFPSS